MSDPQLFPEPEPELSAGQRWLRDSQAAAAEQRARFKPVEDLVSDRLNEDLLGLPPRSPEAVEAAVEAREAAIEAVDSDDADAAWKVAALEALDELGRELEDLTTDDLWHRLDELGVDPPHDGRAMGPLMRHAAKAGLVEQTDQYRPSTRRHMTPIRVWRRPR